MNFASGSEAGGVWQTRQDCFPVVLSCVCVCCACRHTDPSTLPLMHGHSLCPPTELGQNLKSPFTKSHARTAAHATWHAGARQPCSHTQTVSTHSQTLGNRLPCRASSSYLGRIHSRANTVTPTPAPPRTHCRHSQPRDSHHSTFGTHAGRLALPFPSVHLETLKNYAYVSLPPKRSCRLPSFFLSGAPRSGIIMTVVTVCLLGDGKELDLLRDHTGYVLPRWA